MHRLLNSLCINSESLTMDGALPLLIRYRVPRQHAVHNQDNESQHKKLCLWRIYISEKRNSLSRVTSFH